MGLISFLLIIPAIAALLLAFFPFSSRHSRFLALGASMSVMALASAILWQFDGSSADFQFVEKTAWISELGINYEVGIDGISLFLVILTALSGVCIVLSTRDHDRIRGFFSLFLFLELSLLGVFVALDLIIFYVFFELMLLPAFLLINGWGAAGRSRAAVRFVLFTAIGSVLMLSSIIYLGWLNADQVGDPAFSIITLSQSLRLEPAIEALLFLGFFLAFAIKTPLVPFHSWLPSAYSEAPNGLTAFMSAVMAKAGLYGFIRFVWPLFPGTLSSGLSELLAILSGKITAISDYIGVGLIGRIFSRAVSAMGTDLSSLFVWILTVGIVYSALIAWMQRDIKKLLGYSSVSHLGVCAIGVLICSTISVSAAVFFMIAHGIVSLGLFLSLDALVYRTSTTEISKLGGLATKLPVLSAVFFIFVVASIALPLTANFIGEFAILLAAFAKYPVQTAVAGSSVILGAVYMLSFYRKSFLGKSDQALKEGDLQNRELIVLVPLSLIIIIAGIFPQPFLSRIEPAARRMEGFVFDAVNSLERQRDFDSGDFPPEDSQVKSSAAMRTGNFIQPGYRLTNQKTDMDHGSV